MDELSKSSFKQTLTELVKHKLIETLKNIFLPSHWVVTVLDTLALLPAEFAALNSHVTLVKGWKLHTPALFLSELTVLQFSASHLICKRYNLPHVNIFALILNKTFNFFPQREKCQRSYIMYLPKCFFLNVAHIVSSTGHKICLINILKLFIWYIEISLELSLNRWVNTFPVRENQNY